jgi:plastocyanin
MGRKSRWTGLLLLVCGLMVAGGRLYRSRTRSPVGADPIPVQSRQVTIDNFTFDPPELTVPVGTTVVWVNHDDVPHNVVEASRGFSSPALDTDERYAHVFGAAGTYAYFCGIHPHMTGRVVVK